MKYYILSALLMLGFKVYAEIEITTDVDCACEGRKQKAFSVTATGEAGPFEFLWKGPEDYTSHAQEPTNIEFPGNYTLKILNSYGCVFSYDIFLPPCPGPTFQFNTTPASPTCPGQITLEDIIGPDTYTSYEWYNEAGDLLPDNQGADIRECRCRQLLYGRH